jgi:hypothetical protein
MTSWVASLEDGLTTLGVIAKRRRERGYRLVSGPANRTFARQAMIFRVREERAADLVD